MTAFATELATDARTRAAHYRLLAEDADARAAGATCDETRKAFAELARGWRNLADETARGR